jgi:8-oxo-dGTP pyrophosphatase MutT (NUDIX family)/aminoglycoside phosphotransferase (APT) family kinase protein
MERAFRLRADAASTQARVVQQRPDEDARAALAAHGVAVERLASVGEGWASDTFEYSISEEPRSWIAQFPRRPSVGDAHRRMHRLVPVLAEHLSFRVPAFELIGEWGDLPFHTYAKLEGSPVGGDVDLDPVTFATIVRELHAFPTDVARDLLQQAGTVEAWRTQYEDLWVDVAARVLPLVPPAVATVITHEHRDFLHHLDFAPVLVHRDLGMSHVLVNDGTAPAVIDFEDATVGDPAIDFVGVFDAFGMTATREVLAHYGEFDSDFTARLRFYRWMGSVHATRYALDIGDDALLTGALRELEVRTATRPRACAAVVRNGKVLMVEHQGAFWMLPGGGIEAGESEAEAAIRELREETGIVGSAERELFRRTYGMGPEVCFLVTSADEPSLTGDPDVTDVAWIPLDSNVDPQLRRVRAALGRS